MKQYLIIILFLLQGGWVFAQQSKSYVHKGNQLYQQKKYTDAEASYRKALTKDKNAAGGFNHNAVIIKTMVFIIADRGIMRCKAHQQFNNGVGRQVISGHGGKGTLS